jgi:hypothetical protein
MDSPVLKRLESAVDELAKTLTELQAKAENDSHPQPSREYLSVKQLALLIPYREQTIRNLISAGEFKAGVHYYKRRRRVVFRWSAVQMWLGEPVSSEEAEVPFYPVHHARTRKRRKAVL